jgi:hypothetical protein
MAKPGKITFTGIAALLIASPMSASEPSTQLRRLASSNTTLFLNDCGSWEITQTGI